MPLRDYLQPSRVLHVELGDHDALDTYTFRIDSVTDGLRVHCAAVRQSLARPG